MASTRFAIAPMKVAQVPKPGADFQIVEREISADLLLATGSNSLPPQPQALKRQ